MIIIVKLLKKKLAVFLSLSLLPVVTVSNLSLAANTVTIDLTDGFSISAPLEITKGNGSNTYTVMKGETKVTGAVDLPLSTTLKLTTRGIPVDTRVSVAFGQDNTNTTTTNRLKMIFSNMIISSDATGNAIFKIGGSTATSNDAVNAEITLEGQNEISTKNPLSGASASYTLHIAHLSDVIIKGNTGNLDVLKIISNPGWTISAGILLQRSSTLTIQSGTIYAAQSGNNGTAIRFFDSGEPTLNIEGGVVSAYSTSGSAIGREDGEGGTNINIWGGKVYAFSAHGSNQTVGLGVSRAATASKTPKISITGNANVFAAVSSTNVYSSAIGVGSSTSDIQASITIEDTTSVVALASTPYRAVTHKTYDQEWTDTPPTISNPTGKAVANMAIFNYNVAKSTPFEFIGKKGTDQVKLGFDGSISLLGPNGSFYNTDMDSVRSVAFTGKDGYECTLLRNGVLQQFDASSQQQEQVVYIPSSGAQFYYNTKDSFAENARWNWMDGMPFAGLQDVSGSLPNNYAWEWSSSGASIQLGSSTQNPAGLMYVSIPIDLSAYETVEDSEFSLELIPTGGCDNGGMGLSLFVLREDGIMRKVFGGTFGTETVDLHRVYGINVDFTAYAGEKINLIFLLDNNDNGIGPDTLLLQALRLKVNGVEAQNQSNWSGITAGFVTSANITTLSLQEGTVPSASYERHKKGYDPKKHIYSSIEENRPLMGAHVYMSEGFKYKNNLEVLNDVFDYVQLDSSAGLNARLDMAGVPWVNVYQPPIPLGLSDATRIASLQNSFPTNINNLANTYSYMLGVTMGSEPHTNPDQLKVDNPNLTGYTGHSLTQLLSWGVEGESTKEFGRWMESLYKTSTPSSEDANGNSFYKDFGYTANSWEELAIKLGSRHEDYLRTIFREYGVGMGIKATDDQFSKNSFNINYTSRLLSSQRRPSFAQSLRQMEMPTKAVGVTYYPRISAGERYDSTNGLAVYDPSKTEFMGSYIYQIGQKDGRSSLYNEFNVNDATGGHPFGRNDPGNLYRGIFGELQYKPATINWFSYSAGSRLGSFVRYDLNPYEAYFAMLKGQLELGQVYREGEFKREKRELGVFLPVAAPAPIGWELAEGSMSYSEVLSPQLEQFGPDVFLSNRYDKIAEYDNSIIVLGFVEGLTDTYLSELLKSIPEDKKIMVIAASSELYCGPGLRTSADFARSLKEVLPISPDGNGGWRLDESDTIPQNKLLDDRRTNISVSTQNSTVKMTVAQNVYSNNAIAANGVMYKDSDNKDAIWISNQGNLMVLSGLPTEGLESLIEEFFGVKPPNVRKAGTHITLNHTISSHEATEVGWYSVDRNQTLYLGEGFVGYDMMRRKPVGEEGAIGETVVRVLDQNSFAVIDAGTGNIELQVLNPKETVVNAKIPTFPFNDLETGSHILPEFVFYSDSLVIVDVDGVREQPKHISDGFYSLPIDKDGRYTFSIAPNLYVENAVYTGDSDAIGITLKVKNNFTKSYNVTVILAAYDGEVMTDLKFAKTATPLEPGDITTITVPPVDCTNDKKIKCFVWDNFQGMAAHLSAVEYPMLPFYK